MAGEKYDIVILGGTPSGIMAAISAARMGKNSIILERSGHIGGLPANGLGATDIHTRNSTTGLFLEFINNIKKYYRTTYGVDSEQMKDCSDGYHFEPFIAEGIFEKMLAAYPSKIKVLKMRQFDFFDSNIEIYNNKINTIKVYNRETKKQEKYEGKVFIDATYEGDLGAAAGIPYRVGRESSLVYNELEAGRTYKYWGGQEGLGSTHEGDNAIQAYNYRLCLTNNPKNKIAIKKPLHYDRHEYVSMIEDVWTGNNTQSVMARVTKAMMEKNRENIKMGHPTKLPGDVWGIAKITNMVKLPNDKWDANNQHRAFISTDLPEENWAWPTSSWDWRDRFAKRLREYTEGLFWFAQHDMALPKHFREAAKEWGYAADEYKDNNNFPRQVYVREGRRFNCIYNFSAKDARLIVDGSRSSLHSSSITASHYALDSHAVRKREAGRIHLDGFVSYPTSAYTVPYGVMVPQEIDNLLLPVPVSASHIGFSTLRMEPCWMAMGQAAGTASSIAIDKQVKMKNVEVELLQDELLKQHATLIYYKDINQKDPDFKCVQYLGLRGYLSDWYVNLDKRVTLKDLKIWSRLSGLNLNKFKNGKRDRRDILQFIYKKITDNSVN